MTFLPVTDPAVSVFALQTRLCDRCRKEKPLDEFPIKEHNNPSGRDRTTSCAPCSDRKRLARKRQQEEKENLPLKLRADDEAPSMSMKSFLDELREQGGIVELDARVDVNAFGLGLDNVKNVEARLRKRGDHLVKCISAAMDYHFT
ncbi:hypothetical protein OBBRIDRAFT_421187 [Obba rivulosa]|uniref:Uncharacterized protein n=1 Tax=Obba rivulosa TaxID=1052685 RepID=A0A8E2AGZ9_9APHY|nr:hypothetical protein OBBRIDRAFT_421187 [Obba rivulosa]